MFGILEMLNDPNRPFIGPNFKALKFWGLILPKNIYLKSLWLMIHISFAIFLITEFIDIWTIKNNLKLLLNNLQITVSAVVTVVKVFTFCYWQQNWWSIINYVTKADLEQRMTDDVKKIKLIRKFTKYSRKITYSYWFLVTMTVTFVMAFPLLKYMVSSSYRRNVKNGTEPYIQIFSSWAPFDTSTIKGYISITIFQAFEDVIGGAYIAAYDSAAIAIMVFFRAEFELLRIDCVNMFGTENEQVSDEIAVQRLKECHRRHMQLIKHCRLYDNCLSPIMLCYMIVCTIMLCVTAYQVTNENNVAQKLMDMEFLLFSITQLFFYCWHSNEVLFASMDLCKAPYESIWWTRSVAQRKHIHILTTQFSKVVIFSVGPFSTLTVATFVQIVKAAYSYYTVLPKQ